VYSTCIHCQAALGSNEAIEAFTTGRRLAFDAAKGRLWVICPKCRRWNLTPLEERWEAVEECERLFRGSRLRVSTDNIGLAKLREGTELIRIGAPQRPEMAAWRYAGDMRRRWLRYGLPLTVVGGTVGSLGMLASFGLTAQVAGIVGVAGVAGLYSRMGQSVRTVLPNGRVVTLNAKRAAGIQICPVDRGWGIAGPEIGEPVAGPRAAYTLRSALTSTNFRGGTREDVDNAVNLLAEVGDAGRFITRVARVSARNAINPLPTHIAIALEMALHEDVERRALEGELAELRQDWVLADEIAEIADNLMLPADIEQRLQDLRRAPSP
jgi:hypothetical protein